MILVFNHALVSNRRFWLNHWETFLSIFPSRSGLKLSDCGLLWLFNSGELTISVEKLSFCLSFLNDDLFDVVPLFENWHILFHVLKYFILVLYTIFNMNFWERSIFIFLRKQTKFSFKNFELGWILSRENFFLLLILIWLIWRIRLLKRTFRLGKFFFFNDFWFWNFRIYSWLLIFFKMGHQSV